MSASKSAIHFSLQGFTSILIGVYLIVGGIIMDKILTNFLVEDSPMMFLSPQIIEILFLIIIFCVFLFSTLAIYFKGRRKAKKEKYLLFNSNTKKITKYYFTVFLLLFILLWLLNSWNLIEYSTPVFLFLYGLIFAFLKKLHHKNNYLILGVSFFFGVVTLIIPTCWNTSMLILGVAHIVYGIIKS